MNPITWLVLDREEDTSRQERELLVESNPVGDAGFHTAKPFWQPALVAQQQGRVNALRSFRRGFVAED